jgi:hypothetical protein
LSKSIRGGSTIDQLEQPDRLIFDLDPGEGMPWEAVIDAARDVRDRLAAFGLQSFVKTSGGKGLRILAPIAAPAYVSYTRSLARLFQYSSAATTVSTCQATAASIVLGMAFVRAEAEAANCGNDHKTRNEAEAATPSVTLFELRIFFTQFPIPSELLASRSGRSLSGLRAVDGGVISERTLPSENAAASVRMGESTFFGNQRFQRRT